MQTKTTPRRNKRGLALLTAKTFLCVICISAVLAWLAFGQGGGAFGSHVRRDFSRLTGFCLSCRQGDIDPNLTFVKTALDAGDITPELESKAKEFALRYGLQIQLDGQNFRYLLIAQNQRLELFASAATEAGLAEANGKVEMIVTQKIADLGKAPYLASFAVENEVVEKQKSLNKDGTSVETNIVILARQPRLNELYGVAAALKRSDPSYLAPGDKIGIKFYFLKDSLYKEEQHFAYFTSDKDGRAAVYITAGTTDKLAATELDAPAWALPTRFGRTGSHFDTVESLLLHELSHSHQVRMGWNSDPDKRKQMTAATGFVSYVDDKTRETIYLIQVKNKDQQTGQQTDYYRLDSRSVSEKDKRWYNTDVSGKPLDDAGHPVDSLEKAHSLSNKEVAAQAVVPPSSTYFDTPDEIFAEAMKALRMGGEARQSLFALSPQLYVLVKAEDQKELNLAYGAIKVVETRSLVKAGQDLQPLDPVTRLEPTYMRGWDGLVVPVSQAALDALAEAETTAKLKDTLLASLNQGKS